MTETREPGPATAARHPAPGSIPRATYVVRWYRRLVGGTFMFMALVSMAPALTVLTTQPGAAAVVLGVAALVALAAINGSTLAKLTVYDDGLLFSRGILVPPKWIPRAEIDHVALGRGSSAVAAPFFIPVVYLANDRRYKLQSLRGLRRPGRVCVPERIVQELQSWLAQPAAPQGKEGQLTP